jgi:DNA-binding protein YbaB
MQPNGTTPSEAATAEGGVAGLISQFTQLRGAGEAANGLVSVEVDGTGNILSLVIDPKAMRLPSVDLSDAIRAAFDAARAAVQEQLQTMATPPTSLPPDLKSTLDEIGFQAQRRMDEILTLASDVARRVGRET